MKSFLIAALLSHNAATFSPGPSFVERNLPVFYMMCPIGAMIYAAVKLRDMNTPVQRPLQLPTQAEIDAFNAEGGVERMVNELGISDEYHEAVGQ